MHDALFENQGHLSSDVLQDILGKAGISAADSKKALADKGYEKKASDGMQWLGLKLIKDVGDFVDREGNVISLPDDDDPPERRAASQWDEDDLPP